MGELTLQWPSGEWDIRDEVMADGPLSGAIWWLSRSETVSSARFRLTCLSSILMTRIATEPTVWTSRLKDEVQTESQKLRDNWTGTHRGLYASTQYTDLQKERKKIEVD